MQHTEGRFKTIRDLDAYDQAWLPEHDPKAVLLIVHGLGEHSGRYANVVDHVVPLGYAVYAYDHIGHGRSEGRREFVERFEDYIETLATYHRMVAERQEGQPIFLLGHSMGGLIVATYLLDHPSDVQGAVLSAPAVKPSYTISPAVIIAGRILSRVAPGMGLLQLDTSGLSRDPDVVEAYEVDPLVFHGKTPARLGAELLRAMGRVTAEAHRITTPFIALQGSEDRLVEPRGARMLYEKAGSEDKTLRVYEGLYHELFNEPERARVLHDVEAWLEARV